MVAVKDEAEYAQVIHAGIETAEGIAQVGYIPRFSYFEPNR
jgi:hypothetical protein